MHRKNICTVVNRLKMSLDAEFSEDFCDEETSSAKVEKEDQEAEIESDKEVLSIEQVFQHMVSKIQ